MTGNQGPFDKKIKTDFLSHQAGESSQSLIQNVPVLIILVIVGGLCAFGLFKIADYFINFDKNRAMDYVDVKFDRPMERSGVGYVSVEIYNFNPQPISDIKVKYTFKTKSGSDTGGGEFLVHQVIPAGDSRTVEEIELGAMPGAADKMGAELVDLKLGAKTGLTKEQEVMFIEASSKRDKEAVAQFKELVMDAPEFAPAYVGLGKALAASNDLSLAVKSYRKALKIDPDDFNAHYNLGVALFYMKDNESALEEFKKAERLEPDDPAVARAMKQLEGTLVPADRKKETGSGAS
jgi:hypothetical protein